MGDLNGGSLLIAETRIIAQIQLENLSADEWRQQVITENVLQKKSQQTSLRFSGVIRKRLEMMGKVFTLALVSVSERAYIQLLLAGFIVQSPVVADFMQNYLAEARRTYQLKISTHAWQDFVDERINSFPELANYTESTQKKMGANVIKALVDVGYLDSSRHRQLQRVYLLPEVKQLLIKINREPLIDIMESTQ